VPPDLVGKRLPELQRQLADGPMADDDAARGEQFVPSTIRKLSGKRN